MIASYASQRAMRHAATRIRDAVHGVIAAAQRP
jgi:hypothetical protein